MFSKLFKAVIDVASLPVDLVVDVVTLPSTAYNDKNPFTNTEKRLKEIGKNVDDALK